MTLAALAESIGRTVNEKADSVEEQRAGTRVVFTVKVGKQVFAVTCEELAPDRQDPPV